MRLRNEINKIGVNINQIVKNGNLNIYNENDKRELKTEMQSIKNLFERSLNYFFSN